MENDVSYKAIQPYLTEGEYVLWRGKPDKGHLLSKSDIYLIPFSILWSGGVFYSTFTSLKDGFGFEIFFFLFFVAAGMYLLFGRFLHIAWSRKHTYYAITNLKVIRVRNNKVNMLMGSSLPPLTVEIYRNGNGTIHIGHPTRSRRRDFTIYSIPPQNTITLENIPDVARVQRYLTQISAK